ncbi:MAG: glycosyltransferase family 4 protein [Candidatus Thorarchaeota archaeon]
MRLLLISNPANIHTANWYDGLSTEGIDVDVLYEKTWSGNEKEQYVECDLLEAKRGISLIIHSLCRLRVSSVIRDLLARNNVHQRLDFLSKILDRIVEDKGYDMIHAHGLAAAALLASKGAFRPFSISVWGSDILLHPKRKPYLVHLMKDALKEASFIHVQGKLTAEKVIEMVPEVKDKIVIATWGADTNRFKPGENQINLKTMHLPEGRRILSFRALFPLYRVSTIIEAFKQIVLDYEDVHLVVGGNGPEKANLETLVTQLQLDDRVFFVGHVGRDMMSDIFSSSHFYVQFPESDGVPITAMEAMASGLPLISSAVGDISTLVKHGENGLLVDDDSPDALADAMKKILDDEVLRKAMSRKSRELAVNYHNRTKFFRAMAQRMVDAGLTKKSTV